ncbi:MAG: SAM-dependent methyltransferase [Microcoleaceae cyanobacterium]
MGFKLNQVIPWGRSFAEYIEMFDLNLEILSGQILDCAAGPASFNAEMTRQGYDVVSCDPIYQFSAEEIRQRIAATYQTVVEGVGQHYADYVWDNITSPQQLGQVRMAAMEQFLSDFPMGCQAGRYRVAELPQLPFKTIEFNLALCSHFLFTYSDHFSEEFHLNAILQLRRIATEVRIFPLLTVSGEQSPWLHPVIQQLQQHNYQTEIKTVSYEFQTGGNQMLRVF